MTPTQRKHIRKGARRITEAGIEAGCKWYADSYTTSGTLFTNRSNRMFKGSPAGKGGQKD